MHSQLQQQSAQHQIFFELVAEIDSRVIAAGEFQQAKADPVSTFKRLLTAIHRNLDENITMYGLRRSRPDGETTDSHIQIICRVPRSARSPMLEASGVHALMVRDFVEASTIPQDTTVLPKFLCPTTHNLHDLLITSKGVPGAAGIILARRGLALRVWACHVAKAREIYMADDRRITKDNAHVVPRHTYESSGWPTSIEAPSVIHAVKEATGSPPIPTRAYRAAGVYSWTLAFQDAPSTTVHHRSWGPTSRSPACANPATVQSEDPEQRTNNQGQEAEGSS